MERIRKKKLLGFMKKKNIQPSGQYIPKWTVPPLSTLGALFNSPASTPPADADDELDPEEADLESAASAWELHEELSKDLLDRTEDTSSGSLGWPPLHPHEHITRHNVDKEEREIDEIAHDEL
ncbi:MAG: hypothetical protein AB2693_12675 [Candidatus Thiodiazotropha sp.]